MTAFVVCETTSTRKTGTGSIRSGSFGDGSCPYVDTTSNRTITLAHKFFIADTPSKQNPRELSLRAKPFDWYEDMKSAATRQVQSWHPFYLRSHVGTWPAGLAIPCLSAAGCIVAESKDLLFLRGALLRLLTISPQSHPASPSQFRVLHVTANWAEFQ